MDRMFAEQVLNWIPCQQAGFFFVILALVCSASYFGIFDSVFSFCPFLHNWQSLWLKLCCHLLSVLLTLRNGTCPTHCNLSLLHSRHWGGTPATSRVHTHAYTHALLSLHTHLSFGAQMEPRHAKQASCAPYFLQEDLPQGMDGKRKTSMSNCDILYAVEEAARW